jgi:hypothetical protein
MSPSKKKTKPLEPSVVQQSAARQAFESLEPSLSEIHERDVLRVRIDLQRAAAIAHSVALRDAEPARRDVFVRLAKAEFYDLQLLDRLPRLALAAWFSRHQQLGLVAAELRRLAAWPQPHGDRLVGRPISTPG